MGIVILAVRITLAALAIAFAGFVGRVVYLGVKKFFDIDEKTESSK